MSLIPATDATDATGFSMQPPSRVRARDASNSQNRLHRLHRLQTSEVAR